MSRAHCEVVIPPMPGSEITSPDAATWGDLYVDSVIGKVMRRFFKKGTPRDDLDAFHESHIIGGNFAGTKLLSKCDPNRLQAFRYWLYTGESLAAELTLFGTLQIRDDPASQLKVDEKWNEMFPSGQFVPCPLFPHGRPDPFAALRPGGGMKSTLPGDVMRLAEVPARLTCDRAIVVAPSRNKETGHQELDAVFMVPSMSSRFLGTLWNGTLLGAVDLHRLLSQDQAATSAPCLPTADWLAVTVEYYW